MTLFHSKVNQGGEDSGEKISENSIRRLKNL
jgi:hypothetical protein